MRVAKGWLNRDGRATDEFRRTSVGVVICALSSLRVFWVLQGILTLGGFRRLALVECTVSDSVRISILTSISQGIERGVISFDSL